MVEIALLTINGGSLCHHAAISDGWEAPSARSTFCKVTLQECFESLVVAPAPPLFSALTEALETTANDEETNLANELANRLIASEASTSRLTSLRSHTGRLQNRYRHLEPFGGCFAIAKCADLDHYRVCH